MPRTAPRAADFAAFVLFAAAPVAGVILLGGARATAATAEAHSLLLVPDAGSATADGRFPDVDDEEILAFDPSDPGSIVPFLQDANWRSLLGDANRNGRFDDVPAQVDAIAPLGEVVASAFDLLYSFSSDRVFLGGLLVRDGDLVRLEPGGTFGIVISEASLKAALSTSADIDVDAAAFSANGALLFSLDDTVSSTSPQLVSENDGSHLFADETVFEWAPGAPSVRVVLREDDVIRLVNHALGSAYASVVDLQGLESVGGEILFTTGIASGPGVGTIFSARSGGEIAVMDGVVLGGSAFGLETPRDWNGLAATSARIRPLVLDTPAPDVSRVGGGENSRIVVRVAAGTPWGRARILATPLARPLITPTLEGAFGGTGYVFLERSSPMYARSLASPRTLVSLDGRGDAELILRLRSTTPVMALGLQAIDATTLAASHAIVIEIR